jgi:hypothetical protein
MQDKQLQMKKKQSSLKPTYNDGDDDEDDEDLD